MQHSHILQYPRFIAKVVVWATTPHNISSYNKLIKDTNLVKAADLPSGASTEVGLTCICTIFTFKTLWMTLCVCKWDDRSRTSGFLHAATAIKRWWQLYYKWDYGNNLVTICQRVISRVVVCFFFYSITSERTMLFHLLTFTAFIWKLSFLYNLRSFDAKQIKEYIKCDIFVLFFVFFVIKLPDIRY